MNAWREDFYQSAFRDPNTNRASCSITGNARFI